MMTIILALLATAALYLAYQLLDIYLPQKSWKEAVLTRKYTESYSSTSMDQSGGGHETHHTSYLLTIEYPRYSQTEKVSQAVYSQAVVGQKIKVARCLGRFSKKLIKFDVALS